MPPARCTGTLMVGGQPPGSVVTNLSGVGMLRQGRDPEVNGRAGSTAISSPRARLLAAFAGKAAFDAVASVVSFCSAGVGRAAIGLTTAIAAGADAATLVAATSTGAASAGIGAGFAATGTDVSPLRGITCTMR